MKTPLRMLLVALVVVSGTACGASTPTDTTGSEWVGSITTDGEVTTVTNESGSVWGGTATLVEEASIGVEIGADPYMLAAVSSVAASDDRIFVLETRPPVVRVYDFDGRHLMDIGENGQGPTMPMSVVFDPDGRLMVRDDGNARITLFAAEDGEIIETWSLRGGYGTSRQSLVSSDGSYLSPAPVGRNEETDRSIWGYLRLGPAGEEVERLTAPEIDYDPPRLEGRGSEGATVPYSPSALDEITPSGAWIVGVGSTYRFEVHHPGGSTTVIERPGAPPVPISSDESAWRTRATTAARRKNDESFRWTGPAIPNHKPFFLDFYPDYSGRIWVRTSAPSRRTNECTDNPMPGEPMISCWDTQSGLDVFGPDGRFLGDVEIPPGWGNSLFFGNYIRDDLVLKVVTDEAGTIMVKRYRLVLPKDAGDAEQRQ